MACTAETGSSGSVDVGSIEAEDAPALLLEVGDDRPRVAAFECDREPACAIAIELDLEAPEAAGLAGAEGGGDPERLGAVATTALETPGGRVFDDEILLAEGEDGAVEAAGAAIEIDEAEPGAYRVEFARAAGIEDEITVALRVRWGSAESGGSGGGAGDEPGGGGEADNLLANPRFEGGAGDDGCPEDWRCASYPDGAAEFSVVADEGAAGGAAARQVVGDEGASALVGQILAASPGQAYEVGASVRAENVANPPLIHVLFEDESGAFLADERFEAEVGGAGFSRVEGETAAAPPGAASMRVNLSTEDTAGTVWWGGAEVAAAEGDGGDEPIAGIHLCDRGLGDGDLINPHIDDHLESGETLVVCRGTYELASLQLAGDDFTLIAPEGATLRAPAGQNTTITSEGSGYRVAGFIFDQTREGASVSFNPAGDDWQVDHLAWRGEHPGGSRLMAPSVDSEGAEGLIDRVYMGDGQVEGTGSGAVWVNANRGHFGDLTFRRAYMAHFIDNALYATGVPTNGQPGRTHVEDSFFWSSTIANARTGSLSGPCFIRGSVFVLDDTTQACGTGCSSPGARTTRAVWSWYGEVVVEDSDFVIEHGARLDTTQGGSITEEGNRVGPDASEEPPPGVPTSPEAIYDDGPGAP